MAEHAALIALVKVAAVAEEALTARGRVGAQHPVALGDGPDVRASRNHRAHVLVSQGEPLLDRYPSAKDVQVPAADAARLGPDDHVPGRAELGLGHLVDAHLPGRLEGHTPQWTSELSL